MTVTDSIVVDGVEVTITLRPTDDFRVPSAVELGEYAGITNVQMFANIAAGARALLGRSLKALHDAHPVTDMPEPRTRQEIQLERIAEGRGSLTDYVMTGTVMPAPPAVHGR